MKHIAIYVGLTMLVAASAVAGDWAVSGSAAAEGRGFAESPLHAGQLSGGQPSLLVNPQLRFRSENRRHHFTFEPFARLDGRDDERSHLDVREAYWRRVGDGWELLAGVNRVFWGVTESRHLVDTINQTDFVEDIDDEDKLGQPMINFGLQRDWGRLDVFALTGFRERTFAGTEGRLRAPLPVDEDAARFESGAEDDRADLALRYSHFLGDWDIGVHLFHGTGREPALIPDATGSALVPFYSVTNQLGVDAQYTRDAWLWKLEGLWREGQGSTFGAAVGGFEYTRYQIGSSSADLGLLFEYLYDGRDSTAPATVFDDDIFLGARLALNDIQDTELLLGVVRDVHDGSMSGRLEAERRVGNDLNVELEGRWFLDVDTRNALAAFERDSVVTVRVSYFF